jgi:hypothetical protein
VLSPASGRKAERQAGQRTLRPLDCIPTLPSVMYALGGHSKHAAHAAGRPTPVFYCVHLAPFSRTCMVTAAHNCRRSHTAFRRPELANSASIGMLPSNPMHCSACTAQVYYDRSLTMVRHEEVKGRDKPSCTAVSHEQHLMADQGMLSADTIKVTADRSPNQHRQASRAIAGRLPRRCCGCGWLGSGRALLVLL